MGYEVIIRSDGGVVCEFWGVVTPEENRKARLEMCDGDLSNFRKIPYILGDHTRTTNAEHRAEDIKDLAETGNHLLKTYNPDILVALVVPRDVLFGLGRIFHTYFKDDANIGLFRNRREAEDWISEKMKILKSGS